MHRCVSITVHPCGHFHVFSTDSCGRSVPHRALIVSAAGHCVGAGSSQESARRWSHVGMDAHLLLLTMWPLWWSPRRAGGDPTARSGNHARRSQFPDGSNWSFITAAVSEKKWSCRLRVKQAQANHSTQTHLIIFSKGSCSVKLPCLANPVLGRGVLSWRGRPAGKNSFR